MRIIVPGATAVTELPMLAGRSIPLWNVPARGLLGRMQGPKGDEIQADASGGSIVVLADSWDAAANDVHGASIDKTANMALVHRLHERKSVCVINIGVSFSDARARSGTN